MTEQPVDPSQAALNEAQARQAIASAELTEQQALQAKYAALVPDLTKVAAGTVDTSNDKGGMASALSFAAMKHAAQRAHESLHNKIDDMSSMRILLTSDQNLVTSSSAALDVASELEQLNTRAKDLLQPPTARRPAEARALVGTTAISLAAAAIPGVLSFFAKHESLITSVTAANDLAAVAAVAGALMGESNGPTLKSDIFQRAVRGPVYQQADDLAAKLAQLQSLTGDAVTQEVKDLIKLIENTLAAIISVPKGGMLSPLAAANFWNLAFDGATSITHILLVKSETGATTELFDQRQVLSDRVFLAATASITYILIGPGSTICASGTESATMELSGKIDEVMKTSII
jgi:hypothetical protein